MEFVPLNSEGLLDEDGTVYISVTCLHGSCHMGLLAGPSRPAAQAWVHGPAARLSFPLCLLIHSSLQAWFSGHLQASPDVLGQTPRSQSLLALWWFCWNILSSTSFFFNGMRHLRHSGQVFVVKWEEARNPLPVSLVSSLADLPGQRVC